MKINDITDYDKFEKLFLNFIKDKKGFHDLLNFIQNNYELLQFNEEYKKHIPHNVYRGVYFWEDDLNDEGIDIFKLPKEIEQQEKEKPS